MIADNRLALNAGRDEDLLTQKLGVLMKEGFEVSLGVRVSQAEHQLPCRPVDEDREQARHHLARGLAAERQHPLACRIELVGRHLSRSR